MLFFYLGIFFLHSRSRKIKSWWELGIGDFDDLFASLILGGFWDTFCSIAS